MPDTLTLEIGAAVYPLEPMEALDAALASAPAHHWDRLLDARNDLYGVPFVMEPCS